MATSHHVSVLASTPHWDQAISLEPNTTWAIIPSSDSQYSINNKATYNDFHGWSDMSGWDIHIPATVRLSGLSVLFRNFLPGGGNNFLVFSFPPGTDYATVNVGPQGGMIWFIICDKPGSYVDNYGTCDVDVHSTDSAHLGLFVELCDSYKQLGSVDFLKTAVKCGVDIAVGVVSGGKIWGGAAGASSQACTTLLNDVVVATQQCLDERAAAAQKAAADAAAAEEAEAIAQREEAAKEAADEREEEVEREEEAQREAQEHEEEEHDSDEHDGDDHDHDHD